MRSYDNSPPLKLKALGQSLWLDSVGHSTLVAGNLPRLIARNGLSGLVFDPVLLETALAKREAVEEFGPVAATSDTAEDIYRVLTIQDVQRAADLLLPMYNETHGRDGFAGVYVSPEFAYDAESMMEDARALWKQVGRPNLMIRIPATQEALPAIRELTCEGINVNVTLLLSLHRYRAAAEAYLAGLEARNLLGMPVNRVASVAEFSLGALDTACDLLLSSATDGSLSDGERTRLRDHFATAMAKAAYQTYREIFNSEKFLFLVTKGARAQRPAWGTDGGLKLDRRLKYLEGLAGPATVAALSIKTLAALRKHANPMPQLQENLDEANRVLSIFDRFSNMAESAIDEVKEKMIIERVLHRDRTLAALEVLRTASG